MKKIVDLSKWQNKVNYSELGKECSLAILRVQDGSYVKDSMYGIHVKGCQSTGIAYGVYAFARFTSTEDAKVEAKDFYARANQYGKPLFYVIDVEVKTMGNMRAGTEAYLQQLRQLGAGKIGIYIAHHEFESFNIKTSSADFIWLPRYHQNGRDIIAPKFKCDLHQYTDRGKIKGINGAVDLNRLTGSKSLQWFLGENQTYRVTANHLNIREQPSMSGKILGTLSKNEKVIILSVDENGWAEFKYKSKKAYVFRDYLQ